MQVKALSDALGAELCDFDVTRPCDADEQAELRKLFVDYGLLVVRGQDLTGEDQDRFVGYFGPLSQRPDKKESFITNQEPPRIDNSGQSPLVWHSDGMYLEHPGIATSLWAIDVSPNATPTLFANGVRALDRLPVDLRAKVESLHGVYLAPWMDPGVKNRRMREADIPPGVERPRGGRGEHPLAYELPHAHKKTLFADQLMTSHIVELPLDESEAFLDELFTYIYTDDNTYTHTWSTKDIIIWDNISLQHNRPKEMGTETRHLRRQTIRGWNTDEGVLDWGPPGKQEDGY